MGGDKMSITYEEIKEQAGQAAEELINAARLKKFPEAMLPFRR